MISYLTKKLLGTVDFTAQGADIEGFLTKCTGLGIEIKSPKKEKGYILCGKVFAKDYKKMKKPAKKLGLKLKIKRKQGLYFFAKRHKRKIGFAVGCLVIYFSVLIMNAFVWEIEVKGCEAELKEEIIASVDEMGLKKGSRAKGHNVQDIEWSLLRKHTKLASAEVNIQGSKVVISVNEREEEPQMQYDDDMPVNIVASRYGVIRKMNVFDGQKNIAVGDAVMKGDLLVSAVYEDRYNKLTLKHARADIIAETDYNIEVEFPMQQTVVKRGNICRKIIEIEVLGAKIKLGLPQKNKELPRETTKEKLCFCWIELPINVTTTRYFSVKENSITYSFEQARSGALAAIEEKEQTEMANFEILSKSLTEKVKDGKYIINANYICLMNIGEEQQIYSDTPWENTDDMS